MIKVFTAYLAMIAAAFVIGFVLLSVAPGCNMNSKTITIGDSMLQGGCAPQTKRFP